MGREVRDVDSAIKWWTVTFCGSICVGSSWSKAELSFSECAPDGPTAIYRAARFVPSSMTVETTTVVPRD